MTHHCHCGEKSASVVSHTIATDCLTARFLPTSSYVVLLNYFWTDHVPCLAN